MDTVTLPPGEQVRGALPLYREVAPLALEHHAGLALLPTTQSFDFALRAPLLPVTVDEFEHVAADYPIVFYGPTRSAWLVTGLTADRSLFIDDFGVYDPAAYIPAYLRRHPFVLASVDDRPERVVCIDTTSDRLVPRGTPASEPLFEDGALTASAKRAIGLARSVEEAERRTAAFTALIDEYDLFEPRAAAYQPADAPDASPELLLDYVAVSRERLEALDGAALAALSAAGALGPLWAHIFSARAWPRLSRRRDQILGG